MATTKTHGWPSVGFFDSRRGNTCLQPPAPFRTIASMKNPLICVALTAITCLTLGFAVGQVSTSQPTHKRITGIGGIFFKSKDPAALNAWYAQHLGLNTNKYGTTFEWRQPDDGTPTAGTQKAFTQWTPFGEKTKYFAPSDKPFMINYRVQDMDWLLAELKKEGIETVGEVQSDKAGKFAHIMDPEGNKVELWEPNDAEYDKGVTARTK